MPKRTHSRNVAARKLRTAFAGESILAIHPPKLPELIAAVQQAHTPGVLAEVRASFGMHEDDPTRVQRVGNLAVIPITGMIQPKSNYITRYMGGTSLAVLERDFLAAVNDSQIKAIVLFVDSYGGSAEQNDEVSRLIYSSRGKKPIQAFVRGGCCSAAYYLASAADSISASPSSTIGSIGCIATHLEYADAFEEMGIGATVITYGSKKGHGNVYEKLTPDARATLQKWVDDFGQLFTAALARNRGVGADVINSKYGQGAAFLAAEALSLGMIDRVATYEQVLSELNAGPVPLPTVDTKSESATTAGVSAVSQVLPQSAAPAVAAALEVTLDPRIKAMLFAQGLIPSLEASNEVCQAALNGIFVGRSNKPAANATVEQTIAALNGLFAPQATATLLETTSTQAAPAAGTQQAAPIAAPLVNASTQADAVAAERTRVLDLQAAAGDLGIDATALQTAINSGSSYETVVAGWMRGRVQTHRPLNGQVTVGQDGTERFAIDAANALALRAGCDIPVANRNQHVERLQRAPLLVIAQQSLQLSGTRVPEGMQPEEIAEFAMQSPHANRVNIGVMADAAVNRPGDFPNILSNLANLIMLEGIERADSPFEEWTGRVADDLNDFHPAPMVRKGEAEELDEVLDDEAFKELKTSEELLSYLQLGRFGNHVKLTPVMVAQDKVGAFKESLWGLGGAHETKINRLCLSILTGNVTLLDGYALFDDTNHGNIITSGGGAPSDSTWSAMQNKYWAQRVIGSATSPYQGGRLAVALVPPGWDRAAEQTFARLSDLLETKQPVTDATINTYRGKVRWVTDTELQRSSTTIWYGMGDPARRPTVKVAYFRGWGRNGKRERWYDPMTKCQCFSLEGRFGAAASDYRTAVRNPGG